MEGLRAVVLEVEAGPPGPVPVRVVDEEPELVPGDHYEVALPAAARA